MQIRNALSNIADIFLPDYCPICGDSLTLNRCGSLPQLQICNKCFNLAEASEFSIEYAELKRCVKCGYPLTSESETCSRCRQTQWSFDSSISIFLYSGHAKKIISSYKFKNLKTLALYFSNKIYQKYLIQFNDCTIVPTPFRPSAKNNRGWDQIELITDILNTRYSLPVLNCLKRKNGPAQKTMSFNARTENLKNKISLKKNIKMPDKILLVDDVFTTGATMEKCARTLKDAGALKVFCITLAIDL